MREILFRGKRLGKGEWCEGYFVYIPSGRYSQREWLIQTIKEDGRIGQLHTVHERTVGQFTGLLDKNGKKIFEGDIVKVREDRIEGTATVCFYGGSFVICPRTGNIYERTLWDYWYNDWYVEIIGNIHDNPELLGGTDHE